MTFKHVIKFLMNNQTASAFALYKSCYEQTYSYHNLYLIMTCTFLEINDV
jgi:hypothetical protein